MGGAARLHAGAQPSEPKLPVFAVGRADCAPASGAMLRATWLRAEGGMCDAPIASGAQRALPRHRANRAARGPREDCALLTLVLRFIREVFRVFAGIVHGVVGF
jgi:hypothetical protein